MIGLGLGLTTSDKPRDYADLIKSAAQSGGTRGSGSDAVQFEKFNVEGEMTFTEDQSTPSGGHTGLLKAKYDTVQTNTSGLQVRNLVSEELMAPGMFYRVQFKIFLNRSADWLVGAGNTTVTVDCIFGDGLYQQEVAPESLVTFDTGAITTTSQANDVLIRFQTTNDLPAANAEIFIKDFDFKFGATSASVTS